MKRVTGILGALGLGFLLMGVLPGPAAAVTSVTSCGSFASNSSLRLDADLSQTDPAGCLTVGNNVTIDLNGHSITGLGDGNPIDGTGITGGAQAYIKGPGIVAFFAKCIDLAEFALVQDVLAYNCEFQGITLGNASKCVECRVHDIVQGWGIEMGNWCLLESSIVEVSQNGAQVGHNCKVWDLVVDTMDETGLKVNGGGTAVARTVVSHVHNGPGIDYCGCDYAETPVGSGSKPAFSACQDSSNSVMPNVGGSPLVIKDAADAIPGCLGEVITDCATNEAGDRYPGTVNVGSPKDCSTI